MGKKEITQYNICAEWWDFWRFAESFEQILYITSIPIHPLPLLVVVLVVVVNPIPLTKQEIERKFHKSG